MPVYDAKCPTHDFYLVAAESHPEFLCKCPLRSCLAAILADDPSAVVRDYAQEALPENSVVSALGKGVFVPDASVPADALEA
jgi:hypothetical protein